MTAPRPLGYWVRTVDQLLDEQYEESAQATGLGRAEWRLLIRLQSGGIADDTIASAMAPFLDDGETVDEPLKQLIRARLVEHQAAEYRLSADGMWRADEVQQQTMKRIRDRLLDGLTDDDYEHLLATLERIARNLDWQPA